MTDTPKLRILALIHALQDHEAAQLEEPLWRLLADLKGPKPRTPKAGGAR